jgi:hypothetical protein
VSASLILDQEHYCRSIVRDFDKFIGSRNYTIVPMQNDTALDQLESLSPDQQAWVERFPYATILGEIVYLNAITRQDISYAVSTLSRFMAKPTHAACRGLARLLNYLQNTALLGLRYHGFSLNLYAFTDSDWATHALPPADLSRVTLCSWPPLPWPGCHDVNR